MTGIGDIQQDYGFQCLGEANINDLHKASLSISGSCWHNVEIICNNGSTSLEKDSRTVLNLFGTSLLKSSIFNRNELNTLFMLAKREILSLKTTALKWNSLTKKNTIDFGTDSKYHGNIHCQKLIAFLNSIKSAARNKSMIACIQSVDSDNISHIIIHFKQLLLCCGRISSIPDHLIQIAVKDSSGSSPSHQYYHILLDIWLAVLLCVESIKELTHGVQCDDFISNNSNLPISCHNNHSSQLPLLLLWDMTVFAYRKFIKLQPSDYPKVVPYHCTCIFKLWRFIIYTLNNKQKDGDHFWEYWRYVSQELLSNQLVEDETIPLSSFNIKPNFSFNTRLPQFCLWMLTNLSDIFRFNENGIYQSGEKVQSNDMELVKLIRVITKDQNTSNTSERVTVMDEDMEFLLKSCLTLSDLWEPNIENLIPLIDYYMKYLNMSSNCASFSQEFHPTYKSGHDWFFKIMDIRNSKSAGSNNFSLFLYLIGITMAQFLRDEQKLVAQRRLTGRIYPKVNEKWIQKLSQSELEKFFSLLLSLGLFGSLKDMSQKFCNISRMVPITSLNKKIICLKALFSLVHIHQEKNEDANSVIKMLNQQLSNIFDLYINRVMKDLTPHDLMNLILQYLDGLQDVFSNSQSLALSEHLLISETFSKLLPRCGVSELSAVLNVVEQAVLQLQKVHRDAEINFNTDAIWQQKELMNKIELNILPFMKLHATTQTPPKQIANIVVGLTLLCLESDWEKCETFIDSFGLNHRTSPIISSTYLCHILSQSEIIIRLNDQQQEAALGVWLKTSLNKEVASKAQFEGFTKLIFSLPRIQLIYPNPLVEFIDNDSESELLDFSSSLLLQFYRQVRFHWETKCQNFREKMDFRARLLSAFSIFVNEVKTSINVKDASPTNSDNIQRIFLLCGHLILNLGLILYSPEKPDTLMPLILDNTILTRCLLDEKSVPVSLLNVCRDSLPLFILGLAQLGFEGEKHRYVSRKLRELIINYVPKFPIKRGFSNRNHFLLVVLFHSKNYVDKLESSDKFLEFVMETIHKEFLMRMGPYFHMAMTLSLEVMENLSGANKLWLSSKLLTVILRQLLLPARDSKTFELLQQILGTTLLLGNGRKVVVQCLNSFVSEHLAWSSKIVFQLLEDMLKICDGSIISEILPTLTEKIEDIEKKRGAGIDQVLRNGFEKFHGKLSKSNSK